MHDGKSNRNQRSYSGLDLSHGMKHSYYQEDKIYGTKASQQPQAGAPQEGCHDKDNPSYYESQWNKLTQTRRPSAFLYGPNTPKTILKILTHEFQPVRAGKVSTANLGGHVLLGASLDHPLNKLIILVANKFLIEHSRLIKNPSVMSTEDNGVNVAFGTAQAKIAGTNAKRTGHRSSNDAAPVARPHCIHHSSDTPAIRVLLKDADRLRQKI
jgi:hypothetical protein